MVTLLSFEEDTKTSWQEHSWQFVGVLDYNRKKRQYLVQKFHENGELTEESKIGKSPVFLLSLNHNKTVFPLYNCLRHPLFVMLTIRMPSISLCKQTLSTWYPGSDCYSVLRTHVSLLNGFSLPYAWGKRQRLCSSTTCLWIACPPGAERHPLIPPVSSVWKNMLFQRLD